MGCSPGVGPVTAAERGHPPGHDEGEQAVEEIHVSLRRDAKGKLVELFDPKAKAAAAPKPGAAEPAGESVMQIQISEQPEKRLAEIAAGIEAVLSDVRAAPP